MADRPPVSDSTTRSDIERLERAAESTRRLIEREAALTRSAIEHEGDRIRAAVERLEQADERGRAAAMAFATAADVRLAMAAAAALGILMGTSILVGMWWLMTVGLS